MKYFLLKRFHTNNLGYNKSIFFGLLKTRNTNYLVINPNISLENLMINKILEQNWRADSFNIALEIMSDLYKDHHLFSLIRDNYGNKYFLCSSLYDGSLGSICYMQILTDEEVLELGCELGCS